jgi:hypothetical protein
MGGIMKKYSIIWMLMAVIIFGCDGGRAVTEKMELQKMDSISNASWQKLSGTKIYFGHQSVGDNIIAGINELMKSHDSIKLNVMKTDNPSDFNKPVFAHSYVGENDDPNSKIIAFSANIRKGIGSKTDIVFLKLCFWDIRSHSDIKKVFSQYKSSLSELKSQYPKVKFVHFTVPLMSRQNGMKDKIKRMLNLAVETDLDNVKRNELNEMLINEYRDKEPIFDIAAIESTSPGGTRTSFSQNGKKYYVLADDYSRDGGHLNELGKKVVAEQLLIFLSRLSEHK